MTPSGARRVWCELLSPRDLASANVLDALAARGIALLAAVTPADVDGVTDLVRACRDAGVTVGLWPMLHRADGRWANVRTAPLFAAFVRKLVDSLEAASSMPDELALDLEPSFEVLDRPSPVTLARDLRARRSEGESILVGLRRELGLRGVSVLAAAMPTVLADGPRRRWQRLLGTPVEALAVEHTSAMMYTSLLEGYSRGLASRADARAALGLAARAAVRRGFGLSLGAIGTGTLGDEAIYRDPGELADDVAIARAAGVEDLALFSLCGALRRPPIETWLDAFVTTPPAGAIPSTRRAALAWGLARVLAG